MGESQQTRKKRKKKTSKTHRRKSGPRLFSEFGSAAHGLLTKGYSQDHTLSISRHSCNGLNISSNTVKHGTQSTTCIGARYNYKNAAINVKTDTKLNISTTLTLGGEVFPSTNMKASLKLPDYNSSKLKLQFQHFCRNAALFTSFDLNQSPNIMLSASMGTPSIAFGIESKYKTASRSFTQYDAGISIFKPTCSASIILSERCDLLRLAYVHHFVRSRKISAAAELTRRLSKAETSFGVGVSCNVDHLPKVKATLNNQGKLQALIRYKIKPKSSLTISGEFDTRALNRIPGIGLAIALTL